MTLAEESAKSSSRSFFERHVVELENQLCTGD